MSGADLCVQTCTIGPRQIAACAARRVGTLVRDPAPSMVAAILAFVSRCATVAAIKRRSYPLASSE